MRSQTLWLPGCFEGDKEERNSLVCKPDPYSAVLLVFRHQNTSSAAEQGRVYISVALGSNPYRLLSGFS